MQKIRFMPSENWDFNLGLFYTTTSDYPRYDRLITKKRRSTKERCMGLYTSRMDEVVTLRITHIRDLHLYDKSIFTLSYQNFKEGRRRSRFWR